MNTLTWDISFPIALPKLNSNLLSVVSFILLLTMAFMTASVIASHCGPEQSALEAALMDLGIATGLYVAALLSGQVWAIIVAAANHARATKSVDAAQDALTRCENEHNSGSCG